MWRLHFFSQKCGSTRDTKTKWNRGIRLLQFFIKPNWMLRRITVTWSRYIILHSITFLIIVRWHKNKTQSRWDLLFAANVVFSRKICMRYDIVDLVLSGQMRCCDVGNRSTLDRLILQNKIQLMLYIWRMFQINDAVASTSEDSAAKDVTNGQITVTLPDK